MRNIKLSRFKHFLMCILAILIDMTYHTKLFAYKVYDTSNPSYCDSYCKAQGYAFGNAMHCLQAVSIELHSGMVSYYGNSYNKCLCLVSMENQARTNCGNTGECSTHGISNATGRRLHVLNASNSFNCNAGYGECRCNNGYYASNQSCVQCSVGYSCTGGSLVPQGMTTNVGSRACSVGYYQAFKGKDACTACSSGYYNKTTGQSKCTACASGYYNPSSAQYSCTPCGMGYFQSRTGQSTCETCPTLGSVAGASNSGTSNITGCYIADNVGLFSDDKGMYTFAIDCYYTS